MGNVLTTVGSFVKGLIPESFAELFLFIVTVVLVILIVNLFHYTSVQMKVKKDSRCYRDKIINRPGTGKYKASAFSITNGGSEEIYEITYDFGAKTYTIEQKCKAGAVQNKVEIPVYDLATRTEQNIIKYFSCEKDFQTGTKGVIYGGYPGIVKYMQFQNAEFFDKMLFEGE